MDNQKDYRETISPIICPNERGRIREGGENRCTKSESFQNSERERSRSPRDRKSNQASSSADIPNQSEENEENEDSEIIVPETNRIPNTPNVEDYIKHQITHYPFQAWCPICVKNAAQNKPP